MTLNIFKTFEVILKNVMDTTFKEHKIKMPINRISTLTNLNNLSIPKEFHLFQNFIHCVKFLFHFKKPNNREPNFFKRAINTKKYLEIFFHKRFVYILKLFTYF